MNSTVDELRNNITLELLRRDDLPQLQQFRGSAKKLWSHSKPQSQYIVLVAECKPMIGPQLVLDYSAVNKITVIPINCNNSILKEFKVEYSIKDAVFVLSKDSAKKNRMLNAPLISISVIIYNAEPRRGGRYVGQRSMVPEESLNRAEALSKLHKYFKVKGITVPKPFNMSSVRDLTDALRKAFAHMETGKKPYKHTGEVFQVDIEGALLHSLTMEIPVHKLISGKGLISLNNYVVVLYKYFPIKKSGKEFLKCILLGLKSINTGSGITGQAFIDKVEQCQKRHKPGFLEPNNGWVGCHGTFPMYRGFPCAMWSMFHTLVVQAYHKSARDPREVLEAMRGYISTFFGCSDCSSHFLGMAGTIETEVKTLADSVLWLWAAHNRSNKRLHGDPTEDPNFPKVQFPPKEICESCHDEDGRFIKEEVLDFLHEMYTNIQKVTPTQLGFNTSYIGHL